MNDYHVTIDRITLRGISDSFDRQEFHELLQAELQRAFRNERRVDRIADASASRIVIPALALPVNPGPRSLAAALAEQISASMKSVR